MPLTHERHESLLFVLGQRLPPRAQLQLLPPRQLVRLLVPEAAVEVVGPELSEPRVAAVDVAGPAWVLAVTQQQGRPQVQEVGVEA